MSLIFNLHVQNEINCFTKLLMRNTYNKLNIFLIFI